MDDESLPKLKKYRYVVPGDMSVGQFMGILRKRMKLTPEQAIWLFTEKRDLDKKDADQKSTLVTPPTSQSLSEVASSYSDEDGFLYFAVKGENVFG